MKIIIIVEDDKAISEATTLTSEMSGHEVVVTNEVDSLFQLIYKFGPDIILMDFSIGNANGRKLCEEIKLELKYDNIKILLFSAAVSDESEFRNHYSSTLTDLFQNHTILKIFCPKLMDNMKLTNLNITLNF
ncbi:MAG: response regulator [Pedobacter agri]